MELRVEEDLVAGIVPLDVPLDSSEWLVLSDGVFSFLKPVVRRLSSFRKGILGLQSHASRLRTSQAFQRAGAFIERMSAMEKGRFNMRPELAALIAGIV